MPQPADRALYGFRFSWIDALALLAGTVAISWLGDALPVMRWTIAFALGHFFLFCNVVRLHRNYELLWAAAFVIHVALWIQRELAGFSWPLVLAIQTPLTLGLVGLQLRSPDYRGVFAERINPHLDGAIAQRRGE